MSSSPQTNSNRQTIKKKTKIDNAKTVQFYDSFVTRKDIINLSRLIESKQKDYLKTVITRFEDGHKKGNVFHFPAYEFITFQYYQAQTISKATEESQQQCKLSVFSEYLLQMFKYLNAYTFEQKSTFMSLGFYIFIESLERKITQIDSYDILKKLLKPMILLTNTHNIPLFNHENITDFNKFMTNFFYRYYSLYELRMTTYQEVNIYSRLKGENPIVQVEKEEEKDSIHEEDEFQFREVELKVEEDAQIQQEEKHIEPKDEQQIDKLLDEYKLNWNHRLDGSAVISEAEKILTKKK